MESRRFGCMAGVFELLGGIKEQEEGWREMRVSEITVLSVG